MHEVEIDPLTGEPRMAHIVPPKDGVEAAVRVMEARMEGTAVEALCGHVFIPSRDPKALPPCGKCLLIFESKTGSNDGGWKDS
jgi:hypothetical protein